VRLICLLLSGALLGTQFLPSPPQPGTVAGRIELKVNPPQQEASRYPSAGGQMQQPIQPIPSVVYIDGPVSGSPPWPVLQKAAIVQKNFQFAPSLLIIPVGTTVSFPNQDSEFHNVFSYSKAKRFDLGRYPKGESKSVVFSALGIVKIYCEVHPWMRAAILVLENPFYAVAAQDGTFSIRGIPAGHYGLVVWNVDAGSKKVGVNVSAGDTCEIQVLLSGESGVGNSLNADWQQVKGDCCARNR
jgi:plastocyanin